MSWSVSFIGSPSKVATALEAHSATLTGQSQLEYSSAVPFLVGLVNENFGEPGACLTVSASGHGYAVGSEQKNRSLTAKVERVYGVLV
jgi:hypothetical protein